MATRQPKHACTTKVYAESGLKMETQGSRVFGARAIYVCMTEAERAQFRTMLDEIDAKEKPNG